MSLTRMIGLLCGLPGLLPAAAFAFQPLITDDTGTQGTAGNQLEASYNRTTDKAPGTRVTAHEVPLVYARGVTDALDLYVGRADQRIVPEAPAAVEHGWGNAAIGAKWRFYGDEARKLSFALRPEVRFPVSDAREARGLGTARASYGVGLILTQGTAFGAVHANLVADRTNYSDAALNAAERRTHFRLSVAPVWDVTKQWKLALDAGLVTNPDISARARMGYIEFGTILSPNEDVDLALGLIHSVMDGASRSTQLTVGVTWRFQ